jgi:hypothetical protein
MEGVETTLTQVARVTDAPGKELPPADVMAMLSRPMAEHG